MLSRIRIAPNKRSKPPTAHMPVAYARRWLSPYEGKGPKPVVSVFMTQMAFCRVCMHASSDSNNEIGGFLIGQRYADSNSDEHFIVVERALPARYTRQGNLFLTFTQNSLLSIHNEIEKKHQGKRIVGWYHTHPRMSVFLSHYDTWLHRHFFPEPWQVALVVEPHSAIGGFFIRRTDGDLDANRYFGFYELNGNFGHSLVYWRNLQPVEGSWQNLGD